MEANICLLILLFSTLCVDVRSDNFIEEMYKTLKNLEEKVSSNNDKITSLSQKIESNIKEQHQLQDQQPARGKYRSKCHFDLGSFRE